VTGVLLEGGERIAADAVVSNADVLKSHELLGRRAPLRKLRPTMSCFLLYLGTDKPFDKLLHHTLMVGSGYKKFIRDVTRDGRLPSTYSTYLHVPTRSEPEMGVDGGDSICVLLPSRTCAAAASTGTARPRSCATRSSRTSRRRSGSPAWARRSASSTR
jgi:phytoene desaturase